MLQSLRIENLALMDAVSLDFQPGFTAVTGETGAGKSILLGALSLLSGARADKSLIRQGAETCTLEAAFQISADSGLDAVLEAANLPLCEEGQLILRRVLSRDKPSRISINGSLATLAQLQEIGKRWIDFHGPGEPQKLFHETEQLLLLDLFADLEASVRAYASAYRSWRNKLDEMENLRTSTRLSADEASFLQAQIKDIDSLKLSEDRIEQLDHDFRRISSSQELRDLCARLDEGFLGGKGVCDRLQSVLPLARKLAELDPTSEPLADRVESLVIEAADLAGEWRSLGDEADFDPRQIKQIESDMDTWLSLRRRFGPAVESVLAKREEMAERLALQGDLEGTLLKLEKEADELEEASRKQAKALRSKRLKAAHTLGREAETLLRELGFKSPRLTIEVQARKTLGPRGDCDVEMTFAPNPGSPPLPLRKIASSGEMARVMLALKSVLAHVDSTPVLVFDEVDANIGGEVATAVARLLARLGKAHQVFCITHLPQVASVAKNHYLVDKKQTAKTTTVSIRDLEGDHETRLDEFARMLGDRSSASARRHAAALLEGSNT